MSTIGTLADSMASSSEALAMRVRAGQRRLAIAPPEVRSRVLVALTGQLRARRAAVLAANEQDLEAASERRLAPALLERLRLTSFKLDALARGVEQLARQPDPVGRIRRSTELDEGLVLRQVESPIGVLLVIFESRPDAVVQIGSLAMRAGNGVILKGGSEAVHTNRALVACLRASLEEVGAAPDVVMAVEGREAATALLACDDSIDLVIPRGSGELVRAIRARTRIPVLGHSEGICHVLLDAAAEPDMAREIVGDSKCDYPSACNALETLLVYRAFLPRLGPIGEALHARGPVGVEGLMTTRWLLRVSGHVAAAYGAGGQSFTHRPLPS